MTSANTTNYEVIGPGDRLLGVLQAAKNPLRLSEIGRQAGLYVATTQRILAVLPERGHAARTGDIYTVQISR